MGRLLPGKREHSTGGSLLEQHMQLPDLRAQHGYQFVLRGPHTGQPIMLHVSDTAPLQACPLAQIRGCHKDRAARNKRTEPLQVSAISSM